MRIRIAVFAALLGSLVGGGVCAAQASNQPDNHIKSGLATFLTQIVETHPAVQAASRSLAAAEYRATGAARPIYNPEVSLNAEDSEENTYTAGLQMPVDLWGKRAARRSLGEQQALAAQARLALIRQQVASALLSALTVYEATREQVEVAQEAEEKLSDFSAIAQRRYAAGDIGQVDLDLARLAHAEAVKLTADANAALADAEAALTLVSRRRHQNWPSLPATLPDPAMTTLDTTHLVSNLPQVQLAWLERDATQAGVDVARKDAKPDPTLGIEAGREAQSTLVGLSVSIPLFVRDPRTDAIEAALADAETAEIQAMDAASQAGLRIEAAQQRYLLSHEAWLRWSAAAGDSLERGLDRLNRLLESGDIDAGFYLLQVQQRLDAQAAGTELKGTAWQGWGEWLAATARFQQWLGGSMPADHISEMK